VRVRRPGALGGSSYPCATAITFQCVISVNYLISLRDQRTRAFVPG
jgi:hypothetical protein